jgi:hypothetical protein
MLHDQGIEAILLLQHSTHLSIRFPQAHTTDPTLGQIPGSHQLIRVVGFMRTMKPTHSNMHNPGLHPTSVILRPAQSLQRAAEGSPDLVEPVPS